MKKSYFDEVDNSKLLEMQNKLDVMEKVNELYAERNMDKEIKYQIEKQKIKALKLSPEEYETSIKVMCERIGY